MTSSAGQGLSLGGKFFFGGLTAGTFGLGCWQIQRYFEKVQLIHERQIELAMEPTSDWRTAAPFRRRLLEGKLLHHKEVLIGPRGAPSCPRMNPQMGGGMGPSPQGYFVLTPMQLNDGLVWINRGWVPKAMVPGANDRGGDRPSSSRKLESSSSVNLWDRPSGTVQVTAIRSKPEGEWNGAVGVGSFREWHLTANIGIIDWNPFSTQNDCY